MDATDGVTYPTTNTYTVTSLTLGYNYVLKAWSGSEVASMCNGSAMAGRKDEKVSESKSSSSFSQLYSQHCNSSSVVGFI